MGFIGLLVSALLLALALEPLCLEEDSGPAGPALAALLGFAILIGTDWALAAFRLLTPGALYACAAAYAVAGGGTLWARHRRNPARAGLRSPSPWALLVLASLGLCVLYLVFRGSLMFVGEYDALSCHFPKAVEVLRARTIPHLVTGDFRVAYFPWNYELLLADALALTPGDQLSFLPSLLAAFGLCATAYAILRRAWPDAGPREALLGVLFVAATPILIMQAADYKNDTMFSFFLLGTLYWGARWWESGRGREFLLAALSLALCLGTKASVLFLGPVVLLALVRHRSRFTFRAAGGARAWALAAAGLAIMALLAGAGWPLLDKLWCGHFLGDTAMVGGMSGYEANAVPRYIGWGNLWKFPYLALIRPFSSKPWGVWVFWEHRYWWWPSVHPIYGHFGWLCSVLLLALPAGLRRHRLEPGGAAFRVLFSWGLLAFVLFSLPQRYRVDGMFCGFPRYLLGLPVLVAVWTLLPAFTRLRGRARVVVPCLGLVAYFLGQSWTYLKDDATKPLGMILELLGDPTLRPNAGMATLLDRLAGPGDVIGFDSGFGGAVYRLYGPGLTRPLLFLRPGPGRVAIPPQVKWVVIDRAWNVGWSHPGVTSAGDFLLPIKPRPTAEDMALQAQLRNDPEFAMVYNNPSMNQAVFLRRAFMTK